MIIQQNYHFLEMLDFADVRAPEGVIITQIILEHTEGQRGR